MSEQTLETPFNMMIVGMTGCGKTYYLLNMLEEEYFGHFEYIFLICPMYNWNKIKSGLTKTASISILYRAIKTRWMIS